MDWANERYVRVYTRDTLTIRMMAWDERVLFWELLRKVDRTGILDLNGHGAAALQAYLGAPAEVCARAAARWAELGVVELSVDRLVVPNFIEAQETPQSTAQRKRESREARRSSVRGEMSRNVTEVSRNVTDGVQNVTESHAPPRTCHSVPSCAVPSCAVPNLVGADPSEEVVTTQVPDTVSEQPAANTQLGLPLQTKTAKVAKPRRSTPTAEFWQAWRRLYGEAYPAQAYLDTPPDGPAMATLVKAATRAAASHGQVAEHTIGPALVLEVFEHWARAYLADKGAGGFLVQQRHPLRLMGRDLNRYGTPWSPGRDQGNYPYPKMGGGK